jgi:NADH-quinone oxidoreductase E subunit
MLSQSTIHKILQETAKYPDKRAVLLPSLFIVQKEKGWISQQSMEEIANLLKIEPLAVRETVSFYTMFNQKPVGKYHLQVCTNLSCSLLDSRHIVNYLEERLGIESGQTTENMGFTLSLVECLGYCGTAPVMLVNEDLYENLSIEKLEKILSDLESKQS